MEEIKIEKKEVRSLVAAVDYEEKTVDENIFGMVARLSDGHRTFTIGYSNFCITVDADEIVNMLERINGV